jgi:hypothetical protein
VLRCSQMLQSSGLKELLRQCLSPERQAQTASDILCWIWLPAHEAN